MYSVIKKGGITTAFVYNGAATISRITPHKDRRLFSKEVASLVLHMSVDMEIHFIGGKVA